MPRTFLPIRAEMKRAAAVCFAIAAAVLAAWQGSLVAQTPSEQPSPAQVEPQAEAKAAAPVFKPEELEQVVAPIALYPDALLAQVLMASTYPLEIVHAARWLKENPSLKGDAVTKAMEQQDWDPSVKSLVAFPDVLNMMNEELEWTQKLGDAFLAQRKEIMDAVQRLRARAKDAGTLKNSKEQTVKVEAPPAGAPTSQTQTIIIESADPEVVYVPTYNPTVVYGAWPYPAYPPYYYYPPGYVAGAAFFSFSVGVVAGSALWGGCNWGYGDVDINVNRYNDFNRNNVNVDRRQVNNNSWDHDPQHRRGAGYRDAATQQRYGRAGSSEAIRAREDFRGRDVGGELAASDGAGRHRDLGGAGETRDFGGGQAGDLGSRQQGDLGGARNETRGSGADLSGAERRTPSSSRYDSSGGAFGGVDSARSTRANSARGSASRGGMRGGGGRGRGR